MPQMIVRNIPKEVHRRLKELAARNGINAEEQARRLLADGVRAKKPRNAGEVLAEIRRRYPLEPGDELEIPKLRGRIKPVDFS